MAISQETLQGVLETNISEKNREFILRMLHRWPNCTVDACFYDYADFSQIASVRVAYVVAYLIVMALSLLGNAMVCYTVWYHKKMHTVINYYIVNLSVSDLVVSGFVLPLILMEYTAPPELNILSDSLCTILNYTQPIFVFASVLTLMATCIERYVAIVHPLEARKISSKSRARKILAAVWIFPAIFATPYLQGAQVKVIELHSSLGIIRRKHCEDGLDDDFRKGFFTFIFFSIYVIPLLFISVTCVCIARVLLSQPETRQHDIPNYQSSFNESLSRPQVNRQEQSRKKVAKMVIVVCLAFIVAWTPYFMITMTTTYQQHSFFEDGHFFFTLLNINLFAFVNGCTNPVIYAVMSIKFRQGFVRILTCGRWRYSEMRLLHATQTGSDVAASQQFASTATARTSAGCSTKTRTSARSSGSRSSKCSIGKKMSYKEWQKARYAPMVVIRRLLGRRQAIEELELRTLCPTPEPASRRTTMQSDLQVPACVTRVFRRASSLPEVLDADGSGRCFSSVVMSRSSSEGNVSVELYERQLLSPGCHRNQMTSDDDEESAMGGSQRTDVWLQPTSLVRATLRSRVNEEDLPTQRTSKECRAPPVTKMGNRGRENMKTNAVCTPKPRVVSSESAGIVNHVTGPANGSITKHVYKADSNDSIGTSYDDTSFRFASKSPRILFRPSLKNGTSSLKRRRGLFRGGVEDVCL